MLLSPVRGSAKTHLQQRPPVAVLHPDGERNGNVLLCTAPSSHTEHSRLCPGVRNDDTRHGKKKNIKTWICAKKMSPFTTCTLLFLPLEGFALSGFCCASMLQFRGGDCG